MAQVQVIRLSPEQKAVVERKAQNRGLSASSFLLSLALAAPETASVSSRLDLTYACPAEFTPRDA